MKRKVYIYWLIFFITLVTVIIWWAHSTAIGQKTVEIAKTRGLSDPQKSVDDLYRVARGAQAHELVATPVVSSNTNFARTPLEQQYESATDLVAFIEEALKHPEEGGIYLAYRAHTECIRFSSETNRHTIRDIFIRSFAPDDPVLPERLKQFDNVFIGRCKNYKDTHAAGLRDLIKVAKDSNDPLWKNYQAQSISNISQPSEEERSEHLQKLLSSTTDPYLFQDLAQKLGGLAGSNQLRIDGQPIPSQDRHAAQDAATLFLPCQFGTDCGPNSRVALGVCDITRCEPYDLYQSYQRYFSTPEEFQRVMFYHNKFVEILANNQVNRISIQQRPQNK